MLGRLNNVLRVVRARSLQEQYCRPPYFFDEMGGLIYKGFVVRTKQHTAIDSAIWRKGQFEYVLWFAHVVIFCY